MLCKIASDCIGLGKSLLCCLYPFMYTYAAACVHACASAFPWLSVAFTVAVVMLTLMTDLEMADLEMTDMLMT